jgi:two-component system, OmpR family, sensor histidine kinase CiaH
MVGEEISRLRKNFIISTMKSFALVAILIGIFVNVFVLLIDGIQVYTTLNKISDGYISGDLYQDKKVGGFNPFAMVTVQGLRYFKVEADPDTDAIYAMDKINLTDLDSSAAETIAKKALNLPGEFGRYEEYFFKKSTLDNGRILIVCIDHREGIYNFLRLFLITGIVVVFSLLLILVLVRYSSLKAIMPEIRNMRHQKEFITNASHELKTPLAVIRADTEFIEMTQGKSEWTESIMNQIDRMNGLIQNLVMITRSSEQNADNETETKLSDLLKETIDPFAALIKREQKTITMDIQDDVTLNCDPSKMRMLVTVLIDNAIKYCDDNGEISVVLSQGWNKKNAYFAVSNSYASGADVNYKRFFERFYRADSSHHVEKNSKSGYGVGLSVAESVAGQHGGKISVDWKDGIINFRCNLRAV